MEPGLESNTCEKQGNVLIVREDVPEPTTIFLLKGDAFDPRDYEIPLQVFSYLNKTGKVFGLHLLVPRLLRGLLVRYAGKLELSDCLTVLDGPPEGLEKYTEIIDAVDYLGPNLILCKADKLVSRTAWSLLPYLQECMEERCQ